MCSSDLLVTVEGNQIWAIFELDFLEVLEDPGIGSSSPQLTGRTSDLKGVIRDAVVERDNGEKYRVRENEPDGTGITLLRLRDYG